MPGTFRCNSGQCLPMVTFLTIFFYLKSTYWICNSNFCRDFVVMVLDNVRMVVMNSIVVIVLVHIINLPVQMVDVYQQRMNVILIMIAVIIVMKIHISVVCHRLNWFDFVWKCVFFRLKVIDLVELIKFVVLIRINAYRMLHVVMESMIAEIIAMKILVNVQLVMKPVNSVVIMDNAFLEVFDGKTTEKKTITCMSCF